VVTSPVNAEEEFAVVVREMHKCRKIKESESSDLELGQMLANLDNEYDWTLMYHEITK
jgi:hypothetical protein